MDTELTARHHPLAERCVMVDIGHSILVAGHSLFTSGQPCRGLGSDYSEHRHDPVEQRLARLSYHVILDPASARYAQGIVPAHHQP